MKYIIALFFIVASAHATDYRRANVTNVTNINNSYTESMSLGMAMAGIDFDSNIPTAQIGIGGAMYEDSFGNTSSGLAIGIGKRVCKSENSCGLIKFSGGINEGGGSGFNAGFMWNL